MTHTPFAFDEHSALDFRIGSPEQVTAMPALPVMQPFADAILDFFHSLSQRLMRTGQQYPEIAAFGFWCRRSALLNEKKKYDDLEMRLGRGIVFHSTPSNVPVNFAYSFAAGLLAGNANIVRLPAKPFQQVDIICSEIQKLLQEKYTELAPYVCMIKYASTPELNNFFSSICDSRVIWGGDNTIERMRRSPLKPRANEITFADRHSLLVIRAETYLAAKDKKRIAQDFYNDTYFTDQNACTSPRIIVWLGEQKEKAKQIFWQEAHAFVQEKYTLAPVQTVGKLDAFCRVASNKNVSLVPMPDQLITRITVKQLNADLLDYVYHSGFFFEYDANRIEDILPVCSERCQTLTQYGITQEEAKEFIYSCRPRGVDRIVPIGHSMDFTLIWDGVDLVRVLSRCFAGLLYNLL